MAKAKKKAKPRAEKYEEKLAIEGTFEDVINVSVKPLPPKDPDPKQEKKEKPTKK